MGGRGQASRAAPDKYEFLLREIREREATGTDLILAEAYALEYGTSEPLDWQSGYMEAPEPMLSVPAGGLTLRFNPDCQYKYNAIANVLQTVPLLPRALVRGTLNIAIAHVQPPDHPNTIANAFDRDGSITVYGCRPLDRVTLVHELAHNYAARTLHRGADLVGSPYELATQAETPGPYPQGNGNLEEDFVESVALYALANDSFEAAYPLRAAAIRDLLGWDPHP